MDIALLDRPAFDRFQHHRLVISSLAVGAVGLRDDNPSRAWLYCTVTTRSEYRGFSTLDFFSHSVTGPPLWESPCSLSPGVFLGYISPLPWLSGHMVLLSYPRRARHAIIADIPLADGIAHGLDCYRPFFFTASPERCFRLRLLEEVILAI